MTLGLVRTLFPLGATTGPLLVGFLLEDTGSLFIGLCIVSPMALTLLVGGRFLPETGGRGRCSTEGRPHYAAFAVSGAA